MKNNFILSSCKWNHRWGFEDTQFVLHPNKNVLVTGNRYLISGYKMPYFIPFVENATNTSFEEKEREQVKCKIPPSRLTEDQIKMLRRRFAKQFILDDEDRRIHSHGQTTADEVMKALYGKGFDRYADGVLYCVKENDVKSILRVAVKNDFCIVPYGGGTSVSCALQLPPKEKRPIIIVNTTRLSRVLNIDKHNMCVTVEAGITGINLENILNKNGFTLGHEPDSIEFSTVGGWIATNASGMKKNRYGNIEDIVENFSLISPQDTIELKSHYPRVSSGMLLHKFLFGNEGNLGIITKATLKIFTLPSVKKYESIIFHNFEDGVAFLHDLGKTKNIPASIRLVDNVQFRLGQSLRKKETVMSKIKHSLQAYVLRLKKIDLDTITVATILFEGTQKEVSAQYKEISLLVKKYKAMLAGPKNGERGYMLTYAIAYIRDFMADHYIIGETYETTVPWSKIHDVCNKVEAVSSFLHKKYKFPGKSFISARITQIYPTGVCIYFTHGMAYKGVKDPERKFSEIEKIIRKSILEAGGSISHHHGIGKLRAGFIKDISSKVEIRATCAIKTLLDPKNNMGIQNNVFYKP